MLKKEKKKKKRRKMVKSRGENIFIYTPENPYLIFRLGGSTIRFLGFAHHKVKFLMLEIKKNLFD